MKRAWLLLAILTWPNASAAQTSNAVTQSPSSQGRFRDFVDVAILSPTPHVLALGGGVIDQIGRMPEEWTGGAAFGKRYAARHGAGFASDAIGHSVAALIHHRVRYERCACRGLARVKHAIGRAFASIDDEGRSAPNYSLWIAKFSAAGLANAWYPPSYTGSDIIREGSLGIVIAGGLNVLNEFSPDLMKLVPFR